MPKKDKIASRPDEKRARDKLDGGAYRQDDGVSSKSSRAAVVAPTPSDVKAAGQRMDPAKQDQQNNQEQQATPP